MARRKRSSLPQITQTDLEQRLDQVRRTAYGWAWKCTYCGQFACSETLTGKFVCRFHGGTTARQRNVEMRDQARQSGQPVPTPPGRPLKSGLYSRRSRVKVDAIVSDYEARQVDLDCTDEDMLYLRAYLQELLELRPALAPLQASIKQLSDVLQAQEVGVLPLAGQGEGRQGQLAGTLKQARLLLKELRASTEGLERRHERIIKMAKIRAETRIKNHAARQLDVFSLMLSRFMVVLEEQLMPADFAALQQRVARDLAEIPDGILDGSSSVKTSDTRMRLQRTKE